ncbi:hypothetical protein CR513_38699, partial [Mucuna pruriens]
MKLEAVGGNTYHFDNKGSTASRGMNGIVAADNQRFEGYMCVSTKQHATSIKQHAVSIKYKCHNARVESTDWSIGHHDKLAAVQRFWTENLTSVLGFADSSSVANSMLSVAHSTKMAEIDDCVPTVFDLADVVKIANSMTDVTDLTDWMRFRTKLPGSR